MMTDIETKMWDYLLENEIATQDEIELICAINGQNEESLKDILYVRTGYRDFDQLESDFYEEEEETEDED